MQDERRRRGGFRRRHRRMDSFRLPTSGSVGGGGIEIALPAGASREEGAALHLSEASAQQLQPDSLGHVLVDLVADVPPESGKYCAALAQVSRHLDAQAATTVAALCPCLLEQAVGGSSAQLRSNAMALFAELIPRNEETTSLFVAQFCRVLLPAETDKHAMLAVALVAKETMRNLESDGGKAAPAETPAAPSATPVSRRPLIEEICASPPAPPPVQPKTVTRKWVHCWIPLHELLVARLLDTVQTGIGSHVSGVAPTRLHTVMVDAAIDICRLCYSAMGKCDESMHQDRLVQVWTRTGQVLRSVVSVWLIPTDGNGLPGTSAGPCPTLSDLLEAVTLAEHGQHSTVGAGNSSWVVRHRMEWLPWLRWECSALGSTRRLQAALLSSSSTLSAVILLLRAPAVRRKKALVSTSVQEHLLLAVLDASTSSSGDWNVDRLLRAILLSSLLEVCCLAKADDTPLDDLVTRVEQWVVSAPTFDAASPALDVAAELIAYNTKFMVERMTDWLNVDEAAAVGSAAKELLGKSASQALRASSCRMRRWAVQLIGRVASPKSGSNETFAKLASCLTVPLLHTASTCSTSSSEKAEILQVLHQFPVPVVVPAILEQNDLTPTERCAALSRFLQAVVSAHDETVADLSSDTFKEIAAECVGSIFDFARSLNQDCKSIPVQSPPSSPTQLNNPGQIGLAESIDSVASGKVPAGAGLQAQNSEFIDLIVSNLYKWLMTLCGNSTQEPVPGRETARWIRMIQIALEKTFALASDQISLRLLGAALAGDSGTLGKSELATEAYDTILGRCRVQMQGQPALTLELLEEDDRLQAAAATPKRGSRYKVLLRATVRETVDTSSARLRALTVGDVVTVETHAIHEPTGQMRVRLQGKDGGWTSMIAHDGRQILELVDDTNISTPSLVQNLLFERLRPLLVLRMMPADIICDLKFDDGFNSRFVGLIGERLTQPLEFDQVRKLGAEVLGQIVALPDVLASCTAALETMAASGGGIISGDHVLGAKAWVYSACTAIGLWRSRNPRDSVQITAASAESTVECLLRVLQTGAPVPAPGSADLTEEQKLSRGCTDAIAALLCALCSADDVSTVGRTVLEHVVSQLSRPNVTASSTSWATRAIAVLYVLQTAGLMLAGNQPGQSNHNQPLENDAGAQIVLTHAIDPIIELAMGSPTSCSSIEEIPMDHRQGSGDVEGEEHLLMLRPAALQLVFSIVLQLKRVVLEGERRAQIFDVCEAACCAADDNSRLRGAQIAGAIMCAHFTCHAGQAKDDEIADERMIELVMLLQKLATADPNPDVARTATQLVNLGLAS